MVSDHSDESGCEKGFSHQPEVSDLPDLRSYQDADDHELMRLVAEGRRDAMGVLVRRHQARALTLAFRFLGRWDVAEDVCQEAFLRTLQAAPGYAPTAEFSTWLYRVVVNLCWDQRRRAAREPGRLRDNTYLVADEAFRAGAENRELRTRVQDAVAQLPDRQRLALILHRYCDLPHKKIAEVTGWSAGAVESCLVRAYDRLRQELADLRGT